MRNQVENEKLRLMVFKSAKELGDKVDEHLLEKYDLDKEKYTFIVPIKEIFFEDGHLKVEILETVRGKDMFFLTDIGNYSINYNMHGFTNCASPNDLMMQLKDGINACSCHSENINIIMPLLYQGRQHRRNTRESLACGENLKDLDRIKGVKSIMTFDVHDPGVQHAVHNMEFDNFNVSNTMLDSLIKDLSLEELKKIIFIAPDNGATTRRDDYLPSFDSQFIDKEVGSFIKNRDYNDFENGRYRIISHKYCGSDNIEGKTAVIIDDMISSGGSLFDVIKELKKRGVAHIYSITTFALFTRGIQEFDKLYKEKKLDGVYTSNLSYIPEEYKKYEWLHVCDCSKTLADAIYNIHNDLSISGLLHDKSEPLMLLEKKFKGQL